jgi:DNA-binding MarR family transcriptional regulator
MTSPAAPELIISRPEAVARVAGSLLPRASLLTRVLLRRVHHELSRAEVGLLSTLESGPRRITDLAEYEALAQPTITQLVNRLQQRGLVARERDPSDGRAVLVAATGAGREALAEVRSRYGALLAEHVRDMSDSDLAALVAATDALGRLIEALQPEAAR